LTYIGKNMLPSFIDYIQNNDNGIQIVLPFIQQLRQYQIPAINCTPIGSQLMIDIKKNESEPPLSAFIHYQPESYLLDEKQALQITNPMISEAWQNFFHTYFDSYDFHVALINQISEEKKLFPYNSLFCCKKMNIFFHPPCPNCLKPLEICKDDNLLTAHYLKEYSTSVQRFLFCPSCIMDQTFFYSAQPKNIGAPCVKGKWELIREYIVLAKHGEINAEVPCTNCTELDLCSKQQLPEIISFSFYPFYMMLFDMTKITQIEYLELISGINFIRVGQQNAKNPLFSLLKYNSPAAFFYEKNADQLSRFQSTKGFSEKPKSNTKFTVEDKRNIFSIIDRIYQQKCEHEEKGIAEFEESAEELSDDIPVTQYQYKTNSPSEYGEKKSERVNLNATSKQIIRLYLKHMPDPGNSIIEYVNSKGIAANDLLQLSKLFYVDDKRSPKKENSFVQEFISELIKENISEDFKISEELSFRRIIEFQRLLFNEMDRMVEAIRSSYYKDYLTKKDIRHLFSKYIADEIDMEPVKEYFSTINNLFKYTPQAYGSAILEVVKEMLNIFEPEKLGRLSFLDKYSFYDNYISKLSNYKKIIKSGSFIEKVNKIFNNELLKYIENDGGQW